MQGVRVIKIIEAMKAVKANKEKIADLTSRIGNASANLSNEKPLYGDDTATKIKGWLQSIHDTSAENIRLLTAIQRTNMATKVDITLNGNTVTKTIAEWVWRRREYAGLNEVAWRQLTDRRLKAQTIATSTGSVDVTVVRHFDPSERDDMIEALRTEPHKIDAALEVVNAITDLIEQ